MKVHNPDHNETLKPGLQRALDEQRRARGFDPAAWIAAKAMLINDYVQDSKLKSVALGLSGGIDSSVVTGLAVHASRQPGSPIQRVVPVMIPVFSDAASGQSSAVARGMDVIDTYGLRAQILDLSAAHAELIAAIEKSFGAKADPWMKGQSVAHVRTAGLSGIMSLLSQDEKPGILLGTTNRSEGAYLGYVGKFSDGMVDLQVISDLYKSEVYAVARHLGLPQSVLDVIPTGDMYDARPDTEVFGASYDFVELYHGYLELSDEKKEKMRAGFNEDERAQFDAMAANLEHLHGYNGHKYKVGSPAVHLDIQPSGVPGGWKTGLFDSALPEPKSTARFVGRFDLSADFLKAVRDAPVRDLAASDLIITAGDDLYPKTARVLDSLLTPGETQALIRETQGKNWEPVGDDGMKKNYEPGLTPIGSWRLATYSKELAAALWDRIAGRIPMTRVMPEGADFDAHAKMPDAKVWRAVGINPLFRFIRYDPQGENRLVGHYDAPPDVDLKDGRTTLQSLILYLTDTTPGTGGLTRFLKDPQAGTPALARDYSDWPRPGNDDEVLSFVTPQPGLAAIFPHRVLHDSQPITRAAPEKIIVRSDIVWKGIGTP